LRAKAAPGWKNGKPPQPSDQDHRGRNHNKV
jgi:hypothetical protein